MMANEETNNLPCSMVVAHFYLQNVPMALMNKWASPTQITMRQWVRVSEDFVSAVALLLTRHGHMVTSEPTPPMGFLDLLDQSRDVTPAITTPTAVATHCLPLLHKSLSLSLSPSISVSPWPSLVSHFTPSLSLSLSLTPLLVRVLLVVCLSVSSLSVGVFARRSLFSVVSR